MMHPEGFAWLGAGLAIGMAALGTGIGIGILGARSVESAARQPEMAGAIQRLMILAIAFIEALCLYALLVSIMLINEGKAVARARLPEEPPVAIESSHIP